MNTGANESIPLATEKNKPVTTGDVARDAYLLPDTSI